MAAPKECAVARLHWWEYKESDLWIGSFVADFCGRILRCWYSYTEAYTKTQQKERQKDQTRGSSGKTRSGGSRISLRGRAPSVPPGSATDTDWVTWVQWLCLDWSAFQLIPKNSVNLKCKDHTCTSHWRIQGALPAAPQTYWFFCFYILTSRKVAALDLGAPPYGVSVPLWEILDPPLHHYVY